MTELLPPVLAPLSVAAEAQSSAFSQWPGLRSFLALRACLNGDDGWSETGQSDARASTLAAGAQTSLHLSTSLSPARSPTAWAKRM